MPDSCCSSRGRRGAHHSNGQNDRDQDKEGAQDTAREESPEGPPTTTLEQYDQALSSVWSSKLYDPGGFAYLSPAGSVLFSPFSQPTGSFGRNVDT
jgi:hypothetical protein